MIMEEGFYRQVRWTLANLSPNTYFWCESEWTCENLNRVYAKFANRICPDHASFVRSWNEICLLLPIGPMYGIYIYN